MQTTNAALATEPRTVLSVGAGTQELEQWVGEGYKVVRLDIEPRTNPDICASMTDMGAIGEFDVVFCCHALEHLYPHEVTAAIQEFYRVLKPGGKVIILVPDLEDVRPTEEALYRADCGPISGLHLYYGDPQEIANGFPFMAHHCGFVAKTLEKALGLAPFEFIEAKRLPNYNLLGVGRK
jgi:predicted SAM-dependent methyltransferase